MTKYISISSRENRYLRRTIQKNNLDNELFVKNEKIIHYRKKCENISHDYKNLLNSYTFLGSLYDELSENYETLKTKHQQLTEDYDLLLSEYIEEKTT